MRKTVILAGDKTG